MPQSIDRSKWDEDEVVLRLSKSQVDSKLCTSIQCNDYLQISQETMILIRPTNWSWKSLKHPCCGCDLTQHFLNLPSKLRFCTNAHLLTCALCYAVCRRLEAKAYFSFPSRAPAWTQHNKDGMESSPLPFDVCVTQAWTSCVPPHTESSTLQPKKPVYRNP